MALLFHAKVTVSINMVKGPPMTGGGGGGEDYSIGMSAY